MDKTNDTIAKLLPFITELEEGLKLPKGFFELLLKEDDWSFVIKLHSLLEASVTQLLTEALNETELADIFSRLEMSNLTTGKLAFVEKLNLLSTDSRRFIQKLSEVRNDFVHKIEYITVDLGKYFSIIPESKRKGIYKALKWNYKDGKEVKIRTDDTYDLTELIKAIAIITLEYSPKISIWLGGVIILGQVYFGIEEKRFSRKHTEIEEQVINKLMEQIAISNLLDEFKGE